MKTIVYWFVSLSIASLFCPGTLAAQEYTAQASAAEVSDDDEGLMLHGRFKLAFVTLGQHWEQVAAVGQTDYPLAGSFDQSPGTGPLGVALGAEIWWEDIMAVDFRMMMASYKMSIGDSKYSDSLMDVAVGVLYPLWTNDTLTVDSGLWFSHMDAAGFAAVGGAAELRNYGLSGARVGGGLSWQGENTSIRLEVSETFTPAPAKFAFRAALNYRLSEGFSTSLLGASENPPPLVFNLYYDMSSRSMDVVEEVLTVSDQHQTIGVGLTLELDYLDEYL